MLLPIPVDIYHIFYQGISMKVFDRVVGGTFSGNLSLYFAWLIILFCFFITRLPFGVYYYFPIWHPDTGSYFVPLHQALEGQWPFFDVRPPGYPLFLLQILKIKGISLIPAVQAVITLVSSLFLSYAIFRISKKMAIFAAFAIGFYISTDTVVNYDFTLLPESLYASGFIVYMGCLFLLIRSNKTAYLYCLSCVAAVIILLRPAGLFLLVICIMVVIFQALKKGELFSASLSLLPIIFIVVTVCSYNKATMGMFSFVPFGVVSLAGATSVHWEEDASLSLQFNEFIRQHNQSIDSEDKSILKTSWDHVLLYQVYSKYFDPSIGRGFLAGQRDYDGYRAMKKMAWIAIVSHPKQYLKFFVSQFIGFFRNAEAERAFYPALGNQFDLVLASKTYNKNKNFEKYYLEFIDYMGFPANYEIPVEYNALEKVTVKNTMLKEIHEKFSSTLRSIFRGPIWILIYFVSLLFGAIGLAKSKFQCEDSFLLTSIAVIPLGAATLVALSQRALSRYWYPTESAFYLTIAIGVYVVCGKVQEKYEKS